MLASTMVFNGGSPCLLGSGPAKGPRQDPPLCRAQTKWEHGQAGVAGHVEGGATATVMGFCGTGRPARSPETLAEGLARASQGKGLDGRAALLGPLEGLGGQNSIWKNGKVSGWLAGSTGIRWPEGPDVVPPSWLLDKPDSPHARDASGLGP